MIVIINQNNPTMDRLQLLEADSESYHRRQLQLHAAELRKIYRHKRRMQAAGGRAEDHLHADSSS